MTELEKAQERLNVEYEAGRETFLTRLRIDRVWDDEAFARLVAAMRTYCELAQEVETVPKWVAELYWFAPRFTRSWTSNEYWKDTIDYNPAYYQDCYKTLDDLAKWFFTGVPNTQRTPR